MSVGAYRERLARFEKALATEAPTDGQVDGGAGAATGATLSPSNGANDAGAPAVGSRDEIRDLCLIGIPDSPSYIRPAAYRRLLNLSPPSTLLAQYSAFCDELSSRLAALPPPTLGGKEVKEDKLLREIERDVDRTFGGLAWFGASPGEGVKADVEDGFWARLTLLEKADQELAEQRAMEAPAPADDAAPPPSLSLVPPEEDNENEGAVNIPPTPTSPARAPLLPYLQPDHSSARPRTRRQALLRPLFVYATLNPGVSYVQGMSSIVGVFWWIFAAGGSEHEAEACAFFALGAILSQLRDLYTSSLDGTISPRPSSPQIYASGSPAIPIAPTGLGATLARFTTLLTWLDPTVSASLEHKQVDPALYVFRWLTTLFAGEFALPDLVRIWDRVIALYPADSQPQEALSPILGHLIDLSLAMVLLERRTIISPYSNFQKVVTILQDPQIEGEAIDTLLANAWDIRERRLGKGKRMSAESGTTSNWRTAASKWTSAAQAAASAASTSSTANSFKQRWWSSPGSRSRSESVSSDFEHDDGASVDSEGSNTGASPRFGSRTLGTTVRGPIMEEVLTVDGKVLPPPPDAIDHRERTLGNLPPPPDAVDDKGRTLDDLRLPPGVSDDEEDDYGIPTDDEEEVRKVGVEEDEEGEGPSLRELATTGWGGLKSSLNRLAASDAAASAFKTTTNLSIQAAMLKDQLGGQGNERFARIKENVQAASGRLLASTGSESSGPRRPGSPVEEPFTPPRWGSATSSVNGRRAMSPVPFSPMSDGFAPSPTGLLPSPTTSSTDMARSGSGGPKPLLLSSSARRAAAGSQDGALSPSPPGSRRSSFSSPSHSPLHTRGPTLYTDAPVAPLGIVRSHSRGASYAQAPSARLPAASFHARSASASPNSAALGLELSDDVPIRALSLEDESAAQGRLQRSVPRRESSDSTRTIGASSSLPRGFSLSDPPVKKPGLPSLDLSFTKDAPSSSRPKAFSSPTASDGEGAGSARPPAFSSPKIGSESHHDPFAAVSVPLPFSPEESSSTWETPIRRISLHDAPVASGAVVAPPPRTSSRRSSLDSPPQPAPALPQRTSSVASAGTTASTEQQDGSSAPQRSSKIMRRPPAAGRRRLGRSGSSFSGSISSLSELEGGLSAEKRKSVSAFLAGDVGDDTKSNGSGGSMKRKDRSRREGSAGWSEQVQIRDRVQEQDHEAMEVLEDGNWDEATEILNAYGD
ncbi:hypothetical protein MNV49_001435 [Pseudohyphozyma bogoriensis]|nr:hypothetical protein MNV49_001435 [Pseudohyphozyma bogoriensis]